MNKIKSIVLSATLAFSGLTLLAPVASAAGSASLGLSPASGNQTVGKTLSVTVVENSGAVAVNGVEADLNYDSSKLQLLSKNCSGAFEVSAPSSGANLTCATVSPKTGGQSVGVVNFKVITVGSSAISFLPSSQITASDGQGTNVWNGSTAGGSYSLSAAAPAKPRAAAPVAPIAEAAVTQPVKATVKPKAATFTAPEKANNAPFWIAAAGIAAALIAGGYLAYLKTPKQRAAVGKSFKSGFRKFRSKIATF